MSQPRNPADSQALLQSMLQRLKLQTGREGQAHAPVSTRGASTWRQGGERGACDVQKMNNSPVNGFGANGVPSKEFGIFAGDSNHGIKGGEVQQLAHGCAVDRGVISSPTQKDNIDGDTGENRAMGQPAVSPTGTEQLFPARSLKDADITSFERTDGERGNFGTSAMTKQTASNKEAVTGTGQNQDQGFTPRVYMWSPTDASLDTGGQEGQVPHVGNGGFGALAQSKDMQIVPTSQKTTNSSSRRKQRPSENKTARRWTQKIKERWRDRPGSFGKKGKEEGGREDKESEQKTEISPQNQLPAVGSLTNTPNKEEERSLPLLDSSNYTEGSTSEGHIRSIGDFEFGLGSFSLLEEIVMGQEWAKFLNPGQSAASAYHRPSEEPPRHFTIPSNPHDSGQSSLTLNQHGGVNNQWSFGATKASPDSDFSMAQVSPDAFLPVSMDVTEGKQQQYIRREADQSEPMEHGHTRRPPSLVEPANILINSALKTRVQLNRKRQYQSAERRDERLQTEKTSHVSEADRGGSTPSQGQTSSHLMEEAGGSQHDDIMPLYTLNSPPLPLSTTSFPPFSPRGVLKHSISHDSEASMETVTKRRRVEENRRVHFSEEVLSIAPPELDLDATDSEEDSETEEDSVIEQECEEEPAPTEEVAPARRPALPAWILALKRRNTGRKHR